MLTIQNVSRRMQCYNLEHAGLSDEKGPHGYRLIHTTVVDQGRNGALSARKIPRLVPDSLTFAVGETRDVPDVVGECPSIMGAIERKELRVIRQTAENPPPEELRAEEARRQKAQAQKKDEPKTAPVAGEKA